MLTVATAFYWEKEEGGIIMTDMLPAVRPLLPLVARIHTLRLGSSLGAFGLCPCHSLNCAMSVREAREVRWREVK